MGQSVIMDNVEFLTGPMVILKYQYTVFMLKSHSQHTGQWEILNMGLKGISSIDFNGAMENF